ncbi:unnamed protein product, partial [Prorocentrum cordatum]
FADGNTMTHLSAALVVLLVVSEIVIVNTLEEIAIDVENPHVLIKVAFDTLVDLVPVVMNMLVTLFMLATMLSLPLLWQVVKPPTHCRRRTRGGGHTSMMAVGASFVNQLRWTLALCVLPQLLLRPALLPTRLSLNYNPSLASCARRSSQSRRGRIGDWMFKLVKFKNSVNGRRQLAVAEAQLPYDVDNLATWDRAVDPRVFSVGTVAPAAPGAVRDALGPCLADAKLLPEQVDLIGDVVARRFALRVLDSKTEASTRATALVRSLRAYAGLRTFQ